MILWTATPATPATPAGPAAAITYDTMSALVTGYCGELPAHPSEAWPKLDAGYQQRAGWDDYLGFWSTVQSVTVLSVAPRDATSVTAQLRYVGADGSVETEQRWLRVVSVDGTLLIGDSGLAG
ncbi:hypothetical protein [Mycobacterium sp.]|uniref:hypothetical protein n=1 Tax=Mycobacterium sp. TaxID=1785 RepID=UPI003A89ADC6